METLNNIKHKLVQLGYAWEEEYNGASLDFDITCTVHMPNDVRLFFYVLVENEDITQASEKLAAVITAVLPWVTRGTT